jgi:Phosphorylase superfamily
MISGTYQKDNFFKKIELIFVPKGAEYRAICRGLRQINSEVPLILPIPIGVNAFKAYLEHWQQTQDFLNKPGDRVLIMGLCGSLSPSYRVGDIVIYQACGYENDRVSWRECDRDLNTFISNRIHEKAKFVKGLTCDRVIGSAKEKLHLACTSQADVADMESYVALEVLQGISVGIVRVVSDDVEQDLPEITDAIASDGSLKTFPLVVKMAQNPVAAMRLIRTSLKGLKVLQQITSELFC